MTAKERWVVHNFLKTVDGVCVLGSEKAAWFKDTEGNILCIHQNL